MESTFTDILENSPLGKESHHPIAYDPGLLFPVPRILNRQKLGIVGKLPFHGKDTWTAYELSWLTSKGKPVSAIGEIIVPCDSPNILESKSMKLYFNSLNGMRFETVDEVKDTIQKDLSSVAGAHVLVHIYPSVNQHTCKIDEWIKGSNLDVLDIECSDFLPNAELLQTTALCNNESLYSHLFKTNCPLTGHPDWASVSITYEGPHIDHPSLLKYLVSYRNHWGFHEDCCESIFNDIQRCCTPVKLTVYLRYTRRGGIDINPFRSNFEQAPENSRLWRQ